MNFENFFNFALAFRKMLRTLLRTYGASGSLKNAFVRGSEFLVQKI